MNKDRQIDLRIFAKFNWEKASSTNEEEIVRSYSDALLKTIVSNLEKEFIILIQKEINTKELLNTDNAISLLKELRDSLHKTLLESKEGQVYLIRIDRVINNSNPRK